MKLKNSHVIIGLTVALVLISASRAIAELNWVEKAEMPTARMGHSAAVVDGKIYVIGGLASETSFLNSKKLAAVEEYDPATNVWTRKTDAPFRTSWTIGSHPVVDGKIYVMGGGNPAVARVDIYDPVTDTWSRGADMPTPRLLLARVAFAGKIYAFGGLASLTNSHTGLATTEVYDPQTDTWTQAAPMPRGVWGHSASVIAGKIHLVGGAYSRDALPLHQVYDPFTDTWFDAKPLPQNTRGHGASVVLGKIYAMGGHLNSGRTPYTDTWVYDPILDTWTETTPLPARRSILASCVLDHKIYAIGGTSATHPLPATSSVFEMNLGYDLNGDGLVDALDMSLIVDHWHTEDTHYDITGDGIVDVQDLIALSEHLFEDYRLITHWGLDEIVGEVAYDSVAENDAVVLGDPAWLPGDGQVGGALQLDGADDHIITPLRLNPAEKNFSVFGWIKSDKPGKVLFSQAGGQDWLLSDAQGVLMTALDSGAGRGAGPLVSNSIITDGRWHRVGLTWDGFSRVLYVDNTVVAEDTQSNLTASTGDIIIGVGSDHASSSFWSGMIDDIQIYNRAIVP